MRAWPLLALVASCGFPKLPQLTGDGGGGDGIGPACAGCVLAAVEPAMAPVSFTLTIEGKFVDPTIVTFPGGVTAPATLIDGGTNRATVVVPAGATTGVITVGDSSVPFRTTSFLPTIGDFSNQYEQADYARQTPDLGGTLDGATTAVIGGRLYVIGGETGGAATNAILVATINADGTLGPFATALNRLVRQRSGATSTLIGNTLYVIGGLSDSGAALETVEFAPVMANGTLGPFAIASAALQTKRSGHTTQVIGNLLYVIGGRDNNNTYLTSIETATIGSEGVLGAFSPAGDLPDARYSATSVVAGNNLYVLGGQSTMSVAFDSWTQAPINGDGTLGGFVTPSTTHMNAKRVGATSMVSNGVLYVIGGAVTAGGGTFTNSIDAATLQSDGSLGTFALLTSAHLVTVRGSFASAVVGNYIYLLGGITDGPTGLGDIERASLLPGSLGSFTELAMTLAIPRHGHASAVIGDNYYAIGGEDINGLIRDSVEGTQFAADGTFQMFTDASQLQTPRFRPSSAVIGDRLYVIGGQTLADSSGSGEIEYATINPDGSLTGFTIYTAVSLGIGRYGAAAFVLDGYLFIVGGTSINGNEPTIEVASFNSDVLGGFDSVGTQANPVASASSAAIGGDICLFGGSNTSTAECARYNTNGTTGTFGSGTTLDVPLNAPTNVFIGNMIYVIGGLSDNVDTAAIETTDVGRLGVVGAFGNAASTLRVPRDDHSNTVIGNFVYVFGGENNTAGVLGSIEQATLQ